MTTVAYWAVVWYNLSMKVDWVTETDIRCSVCGQVKPKEKYPWSTSNSRSGYYFSYCKTCRSVRQKENRMQRSPWKERAAKIARRARLAQIPYDLSGDFLEWLWYSQHSLCFYTDYNMVSDLGVGITGNTLSVDKVVPERGYVKENVVFCTQRANTIKNNMTLEELKMWMPTWYARIVARAPGDF